jgi:hypothetical protein
MFSDRIDKQFENKSDSENIKGLIFSIIDL